MPSIAKVKLSSLTLRVVGPHHLQNVGPAPSFLPGESTDVAPLSRSPSLSPVHQSSQQDGQELNVHHNLVSLFCKVKLFFNLLRKSLDNPKFYRMTDVVSAN